jgi:hypothetical protein
VRREVAAQLTRRGRVLEDLELLDVGVTVASALEQEMALTERAGAAEQRLGPQGDRVAQGGVECRLHGGHWLSLRGVGREGRRVDAPDLDDLVEPTVRRDDLRDPSWMQVATQRATNTGGDLFQTLSIGGNGLNGQATWGNCYIDNVKLLVPEPSTLGLLLLGCAGLLRRR